MYDSGIGHGFIYTIIITILGIAIGFYFASPLSIIYGLVVGGFVGAWMDD